MNTNDLRKAVDDVNEMRSTTDCLPVSRDPTTHMLNFKDAHLDGYFYGPELYPDIVRAMLDIVDAVQDIPVSALGRCGIRTHAAIRRFERLQKKGIPK
jgi:hypothetical protein